MDPVVAEVWSDLRSQISERPDYLMRHASTTSHRLRFPNSSHLNYPRQWCCVWLRCGWDCPQSR